LGPLQFIRTNYLTVVTKTYTHTFSYIQGERERERINTATLKGHEDLLLAWN
jgi:hypothetical protein